MSIKSLEVQQAKLEAKAAKLDERANRWLDKAHASRSSLAKGKYLSKARHYSRMARMIRGS